MKKPLIFLALLVILAISLSAYTPRVIAPEKGYTVPALSIESNDSVISLSDFRGKYLLLTFWASTDAASRVRCNEYESLVDQSAKVCQLSINLDRNERLFKEIVSNDNLNPTHQHNLPPSKADGVLAEFNLSSTLRTFLIDPEGRIISVNPSLDEIAAL